MYKIQVGIPAPILRERREWPFENLDAPFDNGAGMQYHSCVIVPEDGLTPEEFLKKVRGATSYKQRACNKRYAVRMVEEQMRVGEPKQKLVRVWRLEDKPIPVAAVEPDVVDLPEAASAAA